MGPVMSVLPDPDVQREILPEFIAGSLFPCADGRDHSELRRLTLLAAR